jgi:valyl-tRNA synthetase
MIASEIDIEAEKSRLAQELKKIEAVIQRSENKLSNPAFLEKAPSNIVEKEKLKKNELEGKREKLLSHLTQLKHN